ncbi:MAG TPA: glycosyltransferase [Casimicrobiaceae bacterium]|nr:glycosyltransferase [Casimicrobiaceae bacterium]
MSRPLLSASLIVRDEERHLEACLRSLRGRVDEIVVVDTGSVDRSRDIARSFGAKVLERRWTGDFAAARNASVDAAAGAWLLYIDADETLVAFDRDRVERELADPGCVAYTVLFRPSAGYTRYREHRLFRNRPDLRFRGIIHESLIPALDEIRARERLEVGASGVALDHHGYGAEAAHKPARDIPLLRRRLRSDPGHVYSWAHLGSALLASGDEAAAEVAWRSGIAAARASTTRTLADSLPHLHLARLLLDRRRDASDLIAEALRLFPGNHALGWLAGRRLLESGLYDEATPYFERLAAIDAEGLEPGTLAYDASIFGANAHAALGLCAFRLGRFPESAAHYARAEALAPGNEAIRAKRLFAEARARSESATG